MGEHSAKKDVSGGGITDERAKLATHLRME